MNILVVAATKDEIAGLLAEYGIATNGGAEQKYATANGTLHILVTGVGMVATAYAMGQYLAAHSINMAINLGIAGSFDRNIALGTVVEVIEDTFTELGAEDDDRFLTLDALGFGQTQYKTPERLGSYITPINLWQVTGATVNTVHGNQNSISKLQQRITPQVESMEGAAFFYACEQARVPALQIRAVSNFVEKRNRDAWKIGLAVKNLNTFAVDFLKSITSAQ